MNCPLSGAVETTLVPCLRLRHGVTTATVDASTN